MATPVRWRGHRFLNDLGYLASPKTCFAMPLSTPHPLYTFLLLLLFPAPFQAIAQTVPTVEWHRALGGSEEDRALDIISTATGSITVGYTLSNDGDVTGNHGFTDFWVVAQDQQGTIQWQKTYGGTRGENAQSIAPVIGGGFILTGSSSSNDGDVVGPDHEASTDIWTIRTDSMGSLLWQLKIGSLLTDGGMAIRQAPDGSFFLFGYISSDSGDISMSHGNGDFWLGKLDNNGELLWQHTYGGSDLDAPNDMCLTPDGGCVLVGSTLSGDGDITGVHHGGIFLGDGWVLKVDSEGEIDWQKALGGSSDDTFLSITPATTGGYFIGGWTESNDGDVSGNHGQADGWVVKLDEQGQMQWQRCLGGSGNDQFNGLYATNDGGVITVGGTSSLDGDVSYNLGGVDGWVVKLDSMGNLEWNLPLGGSGPDQFWAIDQAGDGGFLLAGETQSNDGHATGSHGERDFWVVKLGPEPTGIQEQPTQAPLLAFPNPVQEMLHLTFTLRSPGTVQLELHDQFGRSALPALQRRSPSGQQSWEIDTSSLAPGMYHLTLATPEGTRTRSLVKVR